MWICNPVYYLFQDKMVGQIHSPVSVLKMVELCNVTLT